ncbi:MAG: hypothetical protein IBJ18_02440 [Phycisphaerales bacterium]|nr:hypothetical protein [Phycisphaerales bacterium]
MSLDLRDSHSVAAAFLRGAQANRESVLRRGSIEVLTPDDPTPALIVTGDLHDNPISFARLLKAAGMDGPEGSVPRAHLTLHELIHPDTLSNGRDLSVRVFAKVADLKARFPRHVHTLLANHELAEIVGAGIIKDGVNVVKLFDEGVEFLFGEDAPMVMDALREFVRSMPLGLRCVGAGAPLADGRPGDLLCAHSLPGPDLFDRFDPGILERDITEDDRTPRRGSAHILVWGRGQSEALVEDLSHRWNVGTFVLGHEKAPEGWLRLANRAVVLNTDHHEGVYAELDVRNPWDAGAIASYCIKIAAIDD